MDENRRGHRGGAALRAMTMEIEIDGPAVERAPALIDFFQDFGRLFLREAQALSNQRIEGGSGLYERSFAVELIPGSNGPTLVCGNGAPHAIYVEEDTSAHDIVPKDKKALRWFDPPGGGEGAAVFSQKVRHPGTKGMHIVRDAVTAAADSLQPNQGRLL